MSAMPSPSPLLFCCDPNLGRLARWLRMLGYDTGYLRCWDIERVCQALDEGRIMLTRRRKYQGREGYLVIIEDRWCDQLRELNDFIPLATTLRPFSRCNRCNSALTYIDPEDIRGRVPEYVYVTQAVFARCPCCYRIYWQGTHTTRAAAIMRSVLGAVDRT